MQLHNQRSIESLRIFPFIAWGLIVLFAVFVYNLTTEVSDATERLQSAQAHKFNVAEVETRLEN